MDNCPITPLPTEEEFSFRMFREGFICEVCRLRISYRGLHEDLVYYEGSWLDEATPIEFLQEVLPYMATLKARYKRAWMDGK